MEYINYPQNNLYPPNGIHHISFEDTNIKDAKRIKLDCVENPAPIRALSPNEQIQAEIARRLEENRLNECFKLKSFLDQQLAQSIYKDYTYQEHKKRPPINAVSRTNDERATRKNVAARHTRFLKNREEFCVQQTAVFAKNALSRMKDEIHEADREIEELEEMMKKIGALSMLEDLKRPYENVEVRKDVSEAATTASIASTIAESDIFEITNYEDFEEGLHPRPQSTILFSAEDFPRTLTNPVTRQDEDEYYLHTSEYNPLDLRIDWKKFEHEEFFSTEDSPLDLRIDLKKSGYEF